MDYRSQNNAGKARGNHRACRGANRAKMLARGPGTQIRAEVELPREKDDPQEQGTNPRAMDGSGHSVCFIR